MTTHSTPSKNKRRKDRRAAYRAAVNAVGQNPHDGVALAALGDLMGRYCSMIDGQIDGIGKFSEDTARQDEDEQAFINGLQRQISGNGWVSVETPAGLVQVKADIHDYIDLRSTTRRRQDQLNASVAKHLHQRAIRQIQPRHPIR